MFKSCSKIKVLFYNFNILVFSAAVKMQRFHFIRNYEIFKTMKIFLLKHFMALILRNLNTFVNVEFIFPGYFRSRTKWIENLDECNLIMAAAVWQVIKQTRKKLINVKLPNKDDEQEKKEESTSEFTNPN